ncbi:MAG: hypothetical protein QGD94_06325 [Planctomycetia bacterium]|nr:hypothetical protein [Planctomycetia bacterium]
MADEKQLWKIRRDGDKAAERTGCESPARKRPPPAKLAASGRLEARIGTFRGPAGPAGDDRAGNMERR